MLVIPKVQGLALKLNNPQIVLKSIPTAKPLSVRGQELVVCPHKLTEVWALRKLGINAPSPIMHYYNWKGKFKPYEHQKNTADFLTIHKRCLVLNEIGTGKTQSALWASDYLMELGLVKKCLILSPLSTLERVWSDAIFMSFIDRRATVLYGSAERRRKLLKIPSDYYIINHDGFQVVMDDLNDFDLVIVDEAAVYRTPSTNRFKLFRKWLNKNPDIRLWLMTGTPTPNDPTDAWTLAKMVENPHVSKTYTAFKEQVMMKIGQWKWLPRPESVDIVKHVLQPAVRYTRDECFDLPSTVYQTRMVKLTKDQEKHYKSMLRSFVTEVQAEGKITAVNEAVKMQKLVQISCGVAYGDDGRNIELDASPRINVVKDIIDEAGGKVIVFVPLTGTLHMLNKELSKHYTTGVVNGSVSAKERNEIFYNFQETEDPRVLIAHPATMAHGLTLTSASTVVWYGPINSNEQYTQANGRVERIGKRHTSNVIHIEATQLEYRMYERLKNKQALQGVLLDLIQEMGE